MNEAVNFRGRSIYTDKNIGLELFNSFEVEVCAWDSGGPETGMATAETGRKGFSMKSPLDLGKTDKFSS